jgi:Spy/CpxP family protein refolding chaperone
MVHKLVIALMVCGMVGGMLFFTGCRHEEGRRPDPKRIVSEISSRLNLDESQRSRLTQMVTELEADIVALHDAEPDPHQQMAEMVRSERLDEIELQQLYTAKREKVDRLAEKIIADLVDFHALLTPEQRETLAERIENHGENGHCRFFHH